MHSGSIIAIASITTNELPRDDRCHEKLHNNYFGEGHTLVCEYQLYFINERVYVDRERGAGPPDPCSWLFIFDVFARSRGADYLGYLKSVAPV